MVGILWLVLWSSCDTLLCVGTIAVCDSKSLGSIRSLWLANHSTADRKKGNEEIILAEKLMGAQDAYMHHWLVNS